MYEKIFALPETERTRKIRENILRHPVANARNVYDNPDYPLYYSGDRWLTRTFLEGWKRNADQPTTLLRRACAEAYALDHSEPVLFEKDLIAGQLDLHPLSADEKAELYAMAREFGFYAPNMRFGRHDHICLDFPKLLRVGVNGLLAEIRERRAALDLNAPETVAENTEKDEFYRGCEIELAALLGYARRYAAKAREMAECAKDPADAENLRTVAEVLDRVPANPARTFREALQSVHFYVFNLFGLYPGGRPDRYLPPYYEKDLADGVLTVKLAQELVDNYCLLFSTYVFTRAANSIMLGGSDPSGKQVGNAVTAHFLHSISHVGRPDPNYSYAVTGDPDPELFSHALKMIAAGYGHPSFYNDRGITDSLIRRGVPPEDACNFINTTCSEITVCGKTSAWTTCPFVNCVQIFHDALHSGRDFASFEELFETFRGKMAEFVETWRRNYNLHYLEKRRIGAEGFRVSCLIDDCLARGKTIWNGGARYNPLLPSFIGVSNVAEALSTYDRLVFRTHEYRWEELTEIVDSDYRGHEELRQRILHRLPHYGNADPETDESMRKVMRMILDVCEGRWNFRGGPVVPGAFPYMVHINAGTLPGADGRHAGTPLASCPGPLNGYDANGPTASLLSSSSWRQTDFLGGVTMNLRFTRKTLNDAGVENIGALIRTFFARDGMQLQINCVDSEMLKDAQRNPESYGDLLVRIGGYSDFFTGQSEKMQNDIIRRTAFEV